jgi:hypothetical protein
MKNKLLVFIFMCLVFSLAIPKTRAADANTQGSNGESLSECTDCTTVWYSGSQAIRFTLVDKRDGKRIGPNTVDYSNQYNNKSFMNGVYFHGFKSKLDYLPSDENTSISGDLRKGYFTKKPIGSLPNLVGTNIDKNKDMEAYLDNTFIHTNNPFNFLQLLTDLGENKLSEAIMDAIVSFDPIYRNLTIEEKWQKIKVDILKDAQYQHYSFIVEPVIYIGARDGELAPTYINEAYHGKTFAITPMEAALVFPATKGECKVGSNYKSVCSTVTHKMLINALYLDGHDSQTKINTQYYFKESTIRRQATQIALFGNESIISNSFPSGPYNLLRDVIGTTDTSPGIGLGYLDLIADIINICDPTKECCIPTGCDIPVIDRCSVSSNLPDVPKCNIGGCGTTVSASDDTNWANIIGDTDHLDNDTGMGSKYLLTDWTESTDLTDITSLKCNLSYLAPVYCRQNATSSFPNTPTNQVYPGTNFTFDPIKMTISKECYSKVNVSGWYADYIESRKRESVSGVNYHRTIVLNNSWNSLYSKSLSTVPNSVSGGEVTATDLGKLNNMDVLNVNKGGANYCTTGWVDVNEYIETIAKNDPTYTYKCDASKISKPLGEADYKIELSGDKCITTKTVIDGTFIDWDTGITYYTYKWDTKTTSSPADIATTKDNWSYTCTYNGTYGSDSDTFTSVTPRMRGAASVGALHLGWSGSGCYLQRGAGYGAKFDKWSYRFSTNDVLADDVFMDKLAITGISVGNQFYEVTAPYRDTSYRDSYGGCLSDGLNKYTPSITKWSDIYNGYTKRLADLIAAMKPSDIFDWTVKTKAPGISATHTQQTTTDTISNTYGLIAVVIDGEDAEGDRVKCTTLTCENVKKLTGLTEIYSEVTGEKQTVYNYSLPDNTNRYILKPSGIASSSIPDINNTYGTYYNVGYPNYFVAMNALATKGSGSITLNYSGLGQNNYFDKACGGGTYGTYTCPYNTSENVDNGCVGNECDPNPRSFKYVYRTIDLDNPFPYNDGEDRQPGYNWRAYPELVPNIITNNRGVTTTEIYNLDPMYSFDFTGSNRNKLIEIRNYNKRNKFQDIKYVDGNIKCTEGNECRSIFLDSNLFDNVLSGCGNNDSDFNYCNN